ncbi:heterokaryon incompatibility protein-domain-containing protein [Diplogelasinospora grovesii]|uniref:Heterokaryon incompatibility protein-domain-containing protein n=1 Tax=Diplogelasinospora grovesii TaxID=303347 RepID=A0AAN6S1E1_9PEZI|nr:heterokaryon incompatibility protein-domain-containing protein [Diplogelasinospora grovesii]
MDSSQPGVLVPQIVGPVEEEPAAKEPPLRTINFSDNPAVMFVSTGLRRLWLVDPKPLMEAEVGGAPDGPEDAVEAVVKSSMQKMGGWVMNKLPSERYDDDIWREEQTDFTLLDPPISELATSDDNIQGTNCDTPWRRGIYQTYNHVFWDSYQQLKESVPEGGIGEFRPPNVSSITFSLPAKGRNKWQELIQVFERDVFLYPVWLHPQTKVTISVDNNDGRSGKRDREVTLGPWGDTWTSVIWIEGMRRVTFSFHATDGGADSLPVGAVAALFVLATCEARPRSSSSLPLESKGKYVPGVPMMPAEGLREVEDGEPEFWAEADHLSRALFLKAGEGVVERCTFDDLYARIEEEQEEAVPEQRLQRLALDDDASPTIARTTTGLSQSSSVYSPLRTSTGLSEDMATTNMDGDNDIRLLAVKPSADPTADLDTRLVVVSLDNKPYYEAISYTWGDPSDKVLLRCECGGETDGIPIPRNLESALKRLRDPSHQRYVWADSVCINQRDLEERSHQVSIMRSIYAGARRVLVWLGLDTDDQAARAFHAVCDIVRSWRPNGDRLSFSSYANHLEPLDDEAEIGRINSLLSRDGGWEALRAMFETAYFRRFWVIQELALSGIHTEEGGGGAVIIWGDHHISWGLIGICAAWLLTRGWHVVKEGCPGEPITAAYNAFLIYVLPLAKPSGISPFSKLDLSVVLGTTMNRFDATDARDRIYALLGMPFSGNDPDGGLLVRPDYSQSVDSVYVEATRCMLRQDRHLRLLSAVQHRPSPRQVPETPEEGDGGCHPSWVPRWDQPFHAEPLALRSEQGFYANGGELFTPDENTFGEDGSLVLRGLECSTVTSVSEECRKGNLGMTGLSDPEHQKALVPILSELNDERKKLRASWSATLEKFVLWGIRDPAAQEAVCASGKSLQAVVFAQPGKYGVRASVEAVTGEKAINNHLGEFLLYWRERSSWKEEELVQPSMAPFWALIKDVDSPYVWERALCSMNTLVGRRVFKCDDGRFGLGPAAMRPGDVVAILFGGIVPFVLRPVPTENSKGEKIQEWRFVGECFVPGLMQGEAVEAAGLLEPGTYKRAEGGELTLDAVIGEDGARFRRKVGENNVQEFVIR